MAIRVYLIDDGKQSLKVLQDTLTEHKQIEIAATFTGPYYVLEHTQGANCQAVFMDIEMQSTRGLELAAKIKKSNPHMDVVLISAHPDHALEAFDICAFDYLLKPLRRDRLSKTIAKLLEKWNRKERNM